MVDKPNWYIFKWPTSPSALAVGMVNIHPDYKTDNYRITWIGPEMHKEFDDSVEKMICCNCGNELKSLQDIRLHYEREHHINLMGKQPSITADLHSSICWIQFITPYMKEDRELSWNKQEEIDEPIDEDVDWKTGPKYFNNTLKTAMKNIEEHPEREWKLSINKKGNYALQYRELVGTEEGN